LKEAVVTAQTANDATVPVGTDGWNLTAHIKQAIETTRSFIPVASDAQRDALAALFPGGILPIATTIVRTDKTGLPEERWNGTKWLLPAGSQGIMARHIHNTADSGAQAAHVVLHSIASFTFRGGRKYRIALEANYYTDNLDTVVLFRVATCSTADSSTSTVGLTVKNQTDGQPTRTTTGFPVKVYAYFEPVTDTTLQLKATAQRAVGTGSFFMQRSVDAPNIFFVEDLGAQF
jgi:hypothetical protein